METNKVESNKVESRYNRLLNLCRSDGGYFFNYNDGDRDPWTFGMFQDAYINNLDLTTGFTLTPKEVGILVVKKVLMPALSDKEFAIQTALGLAPVRKYVFTEGALTALKKCGASILEQFN